MFLLYISSDWKVCTYLCYFCTIFVLFGFRSLFFYNLFWVVKLPGVKTKQNNLSNKITLWFINSYIQRGKTKVERLSGCFWEIMSLQGLEKQFNNRFKHFSSLHLELQSGIKRLPTECCWLGKRLTLTKVRTFLENWAKRENPRYFFLHNQPQVYFIMMYLKLRLKNEMRIKSFLWVCFNGVQLDPPIKHY